MSEISGRCAGWESEDLLELFSTEVLDEDFFLGLDLEELEEETYEGSGALVGVDAADVCELDGVVDEGLGWRGVSVCAGDEGEEDQ